MVAYLPRSSCLTPESDLSRLDRSSVVSFSKSKSFDNDNEDIPEPVG
jgi:hypothetical protein